MANLDELRARMDKLGRHLAEADEGNAARSPGDTNMRAIADRHTALHARLARSTDVDADVEGEVDELLGAFDRWAKTQDKEFNQG